MEIQEIEDFLRNKSGYLKKGPKTLRHHLFNKGITTTIKKCKAALETVRAEKRELNQKVEEGEARILIYDIETSPNIGWFWRSGYKLNIDAGQIIKERAIICVSYKWVGESQVYNLAWDSDQNDKFLLEQFVDVLGEADLIVAHNGENFDLKWLRTRALIHGIPMLVNYKQFDTLKLARSKFYFNSNRLDYISKVLGFEGKLDTEYGLWNDVTFKNDRKALKKMLDYCDEDVRQLEKVYNILKYSDNPSYHLGILQGKTKLTSPITGGVNIKHIKIVTTNRGTIKHIMKDLDTDRLFEMSNTNYNKFLAINK